MAQQNRQFQDAIEKLKSLETNAATIAKSAASISDPSKNILLVLSQLKRVGITVDDVDALNVLHVAGTKGKGSTAAFCESILRHHGYRTGSYSAPHLISEADRIRLNGQPLSDDDFAKYFFQVYDQLHSTRADDSDMPFYFGFMTIMAFYVFVEERVDVAILEVGIGGEYDNTNVVSRPVACGVACLDYDHTVLLGTTMDSIAWNKAGIFKFGVPAFTVEQEVERDVSMKVLLDRSKEKRCPLYVVPALQEEDLGGRQLGIPGTHQLANAALAVQMCRVFMARQAREVEDLPRTKLTDKEIQGLARCFWPGRCQTLERDGVTFYLDGAHTPHSMQCCAEWFEEAAKQEISKKGLDRAQVKRCLIFNVTAKRDAGRLFEQLKNVIQGDLEVAIFSPNTPRSDIQQPEHKIEEYVAKWNATASASSVVCSNVQAALDKAREIGAGKTLTQVLVTGSIHLVGSVLSILDPHSFQRAAQA